uniref:Homeobox domain-containing protein n=1 Tax=Leersia perrieri TaxID=77586 RepID=A0A0D9VDY8_9ORYZ
MVDFHPTMSSNPSFSHFGFDAMNGYFMSTATGNALLAAGDSPLFHPTMAPPDHGGETAAMEFAAANNLVLASLATQLFGAAPAPPQPEEEMGGGGGGYGVAGGESSGAVSLACLGHSDAMAAASAGWSPEKKPSCNWIGNNAGGWLFAGLPEAAAAAGFVYAATPATASELSLSLCSRSSSESFLNAAAAGDATSHRLRSELLTILQLMDQKYNQCLDEIQTTTARFSGAGAAGICAPFAHRAVSAMYHGLRRRIAGEIMSATARPCRGGHESSSAVTGGGERERNWESAFIQKHWAVHQLRRGEQQCWRPQRGLPEKSVAVLKAWMFENFLRPYPKDSEKEMLAARSGLSRNQVSNWFINARVRLWKPMIEEMCEELKRSSSGISGGNQALAMEHLSSQDVVS